MQAYSHPTGNMISVGHHVLWSYINPIDDTKHHACVMIWREDSTPKVLIKSAFPASDFILYSRDDFVYILERRFIQSSEAFESRILKMKIGEKPIEIWSWFKDDWRVGEGGFFMASDNQIIFAKYPEVYCLDKGEKPLKYPFETPEPVSRLKAVENNHFLLMADNACYLLNEKGDILKTWSNLLDENIDNAPLNRNRIFDIDYRKGELLIAYWGKRSFETISAHGERKIILQQEEPFVPHWVCYHGTNKMLFSSKLIFDGSTPKPNLLLNKSNRALIEVWKE